MAFKPFSPKQFLPQEFLSKDIYIKWQGKSWMFIDERLLKNYDAVREYLDKPVILNTWFSQSMVDRWRFRSESGLRVPGMVVYSQTSQHSYGRAGDSVGDWSYAQLRRDIMDSKLVLPYPASFELDVNWFHMDVQNIGDDHTYFFHP